MFVTMTTTDGKNVAINPLAIAVILERDATTTAIETTDGHEYTLAADFRDVKVKLESAFNEYRRQLKL
jgi:hypothetical protein